ncbi:LysE family translocator [Moritella sp.]|uniref:LysE family translocator n=1 Tax=Moritella sp. TaxID=78556 RepID=UPI001E19CAFC|nr:LysE family translocator [Moritella sp.]MCJ8349091.1 LysE family translocator [Moritella sp.]NQZ39378.1 LysE family translocator [Moritella sp.]
MSVEILTAFMAFAFVTSVTPGPNNLMLMNSGASFGIRKTVPHVLGIVVGFIFMLLLVGLGIMQIFQRFPVSYDILKILSIAYLLYLAFKIATSNTTLEHNATKTKPFSFIQAAMFQWINPKAWTMALTALSIYATSSDLNTVLFVTLIFAVINLPAISLWVLLGQKMQRFLTSRKRLKAFNITMAMLLVMSLYPVI